MKKKFISLILSALMLPLPIGIHVNAAQTAAEQYLSSMTTEDKISQMIMPVFRSTVDEEGSRANVTEITEDIENSLKKHSFSGVIVMGQNTPTNDGAVRLIDAMQKANAEGGSRPQLLITIDQEGGNVTRLGQGCVMPSNMSLGAANDIELTKEDASVIAGELKALGINADFAPVVDVNNNPSNPIIGIRSFSDDPQIAAKQGAAFVEALNENGVISTLKHFPGHGDTDTDSHTGLPCINKSYDEIKQNELIPFQACIDAGSQMIMTAHIQYPQIEKNTYRSILTDEDIYLPATLSKTIITDILRGDMGFDGVVITDAMEMDAIAKHFDKYDAAKLAIEAGVDILLAPYDPSTKAGFEEMDSYISTLAQMADNGDISMENIDAAVLRILRLKENNGLFSPYDGSDIENRAEYAVNHVGTKENHDKEWDITKKTITLVKNDNDTLPLTKPNQKTVVLVPYDDETIPMNYAVRKLTQDGKLPEGTVFEAYSYRYKTLEDMLPVTEGADNVIFLSEIYSASALQGDIAKMGDTICDKIHERGGKFIVMSVNLPYDAARFQDADAVMIAYLAVSMPVDPEDKVNEMQKYGPNMPVALYMMFSEDDAPTAKLPVNIPQLDENYRYTNDILYERGFGLTYSLDPTGVFSSEYKSSPFYKKLMSALENNKDKTTMEKVAAAALSQEGYQNYSVEGADIAQAKAKGLIWTGKEQRMNSDETGNTEYTRWAESCIMDRSGSSLYADYEWCSIFASWCMYQAGYYSEQQLKRFYYSYCADPRIEYDADAWIEAFCLDQERVWYTPVSAKKLEAYNWNTYYHTETDPFDIPYKPGGLIFFTWDGSGNYFNHVAMVVSYDEDTHVLTYIGGNTDGQVITRMMDLDNEEEFCGKPLLKNSGRIMAYGEYDEIKPLEQKEITADITDIIWDVDSAAGIAIQTNSNSKIVSVSVDGVYLGSNIESNMLLHEGRLTIGKSELVALAHGEHEMQLTFDDGVLMIPFKVVQMKDIKAEHTNITWNRSGDNIIIRTNSESDTVALRIGGGLAETEKTDGISIENGTVTLSAEFANSVLADGENTLKLLFDDGEIVIYVFVTNESQKDIIAEHTNIAWDRSDDNIIIRTNSESDTVAVRIGGGLAGTEKTDGVSIENGTVTLSSEFANSVLADGENTLNLIFNDGEIEISVFVTDEAQKDIIAEHTNITWDRSGDNIIIRTNSESDTVAVRIDGGLAGTEKTDGVSIENGTVTLSSEFANSVLADGENTLNLIFNDGEIEISVFVTNEKSEESSAEVSDKTSDNEISMPQAEDNPPRTGDSYPVTVLALITTALFAVVLSARKKTGKTH